MLTAICCGNDVLAMGVLSVMNEQGIDVPGRISVTGYDDIEFAGVVTPSLTTVSQPMRAMGAAPHERSSSVSPARQAGAQRDDEG